MSTATNLAVVLDMLDTATAAFAAEIEKAKALLGSPPSAPSAPYVGQRVDREGDVAEFLAALPVGSSFRDVEGDLWYVHEGGFAFSPDSRAYRTVCEPSNYVPLVVESLPHTAPEEAEEPTPPAPTRVRFSKKTESRGDILAEPSVFHRDGGAFISFGREIAHLTQEQTASLAAALAAISAT